MNRLPNFLIVGAAKSGTSSLHYYFQGHPNIYMPSERKELRFFSEMSGDYTGPGDERTNSTIIHSLEKYKEYFSSVDEEMCIGESSPDYLFYYEKSIKNIKKYLGDPKIIIILREPVSRAFSHYMMYVRDGRETLSFEEALEMEQERKNAHREWGWQYREVGLYYQSVKAYMENFSNVKIVLFDELKSDSKKLLIDLFSYLGIDSSVNIMNTNEIYNISGRPKYRFIHKLFVKQNIIKVIFKPFFDHVFPVKWKKEVIKKVKNRNMLRDKIKPETRSTLNAFYRDDILKLQHLVKKDLSHWHE